VEEQVYIIFVSVRESNVPLENKKQTAGYILFSLLPVGDERQKNCP
jgi:hypothetical protein